ncbi:hypothetical protein [Caballeronia telluris]|uniref:Uncharacterized protein n=1 Tax=Caballeronia telluris TaxID=326475 RepID=A0A158G1M2_9BURK|nr:hypothetical protein [Caballeronia telluris]SAL26028.1 hypothetical protein AWB66_01505 [Caballeronia telluris]
MNTEHYSGRSGRRVSDTQSESFHSLTVKQLCHTQQMVMDCFDSSEILLTREQISAQTNLKLSSVCGRARALIDAGRLQVRGSVRDLHTGKRQELLGLSKA